MNLWGQEQQNRRERQSERRRDRDTGKEAERKIKEQTEEDRVGEVDTALLKGKCAQGLLSGYS